MIKFTEKQQMAHDSKAKVVVFGGAAGGGKSAFVARSAVEYCLSGRNRVSVIANIGIERFICAGGMRDILLSVLDDNYCYYEITGNTIKLRNGSSIVFVTSSDAVDSYCGINSMLYIDEYTHSPVSFGKIINRYAKLFDRVVIATNPTNHNSDGSMIDIHASLESLGFLDHNGFVVESMQGSIVNSENGVTVSFVQSTVHDNTLFIGDRERYLSLLTTLNKEDRDRLYIGKWGCQSSY